MGYIEKSHALSRPVARTWPASVPPRQPGYRRSGRHIISGHGLGLWRGLVFGLPISMLLWAGVYGLIERLF